MKQKRRLPWIWFAAFILAVGLSVTGFAADTYQVTVAGVFDQTEARSMLSMINAFRTGKTVDCPDDYDSWSVKPGSGESWQRTADGSVEIIKGLGTLTYDYTLEKVAMLRAIETAVYWDHNRPSSAAGNCFSAYPSGYTARGENIACGYRSFQTAETVFHAWQETDEDYAGQGHRRNMLYRKFTAVGIAHVTHNGWEFWVQEFGYPVRDTLQTAARNGLGSAVISFSTDRVLPAGLYGSDDSQTITLEYGETVSIPETKIMLQAVSGGISGFSALGKASLTWKISNTAVAALSGNSVTGKKPGKTTLTTSFAGTALSYTVIVEKASLSEAVITGAGAAQFTGSEIEPEVTVKLDGKTLSEGTDYSVSYKNNIQTGKGTVTVAGKGNYQGRVTKKFQIRLPVGFSCKDKTTGAYYKVTKVSSVSRAEVTLVKPLSKNVKKITIPASIKISKTTCKVTAIAAGAFKNRKKLQKVIIGKNISSVGKNAFYGAVKLADIRIRTKLLTSGKVGASAFRGIAQEAVFRLPSAKKKAYRKLLLKKGAEKTMTFK